MFREPAFRSPTSTNRHRAFLDWHKVQVLLDELLDTKHILA